MIGPRQPREPLVVIRSVSKAATALPAYLALLSAEEQAEARRLRQPADRDRFVLGRGLARMLLSGATGLPAAALAFRRNSHGKPRLEGSERLSFNISHSGDLVAVAIGENCDLGVDVERHRPDLDVTSLGRFIFTEAEMAAVQAEGGSARISGFFRQWVFKEALVKGLGTGLARDPKRFQIRADAGEPVAEFVGGEEDDVGRGWRLTALAAPAGYSAALAVRSHAH